MQALVFGSIGSVVECSELQRAAFNEAFAAHGLAWHWSEGEYREMLAISGGQGRIADYARAQNLTVDTAEIHGTKTKIFQSHLKGNCPALRPGVAEALRLARQLGIKTAFASTTQYQSVRAVLDAYDGLLDSLMDHATSAAYGYMQKPSPQVYQAVASELRVPADQMLVVEDNSPGLHAAASAGAVPVAFLGDNTRHHDTSAAAIVAEDNVLLALEPLLADLPALAA